MQIGIIGAGQIGGTLGKTWALKGHEVRFGVRNPDKESLVQQVQEMSGKVQLGTSADAIAHSDVIVFALPGGSVASVVDENIENLQQSIIVDASNNMRSETRHALGYLREKLPSAQLFRAFSSLGWENLENPDFDGVKADLFYCGDAEGRSTLDQLIGDIGLEPVYLGGVDEVRLVEGMTDMWFNLAMRQKMGRRIAFKLLK